MKKKKETKFCCYKDKYKELINREEKKKKLMESPYEKRKREKNEQGNGIESYPKECIVASLRSIIGPYSAFLNNNIEKILVEIIV